MILNQQKKIRLATRALAVFLHKIQRELKLEKMQLTVAFVSDAEIARWNERYRQKKGPTDVLSFPATMQRKKPKGTGAAVKDGKSSRTGEKFLGDIAIAPETARRYAKQNGHSLNCEIRVLMLHGVLHLMGYDHESDHGQMNRIEQKLRRRLGIA
jgi:rRNA maturation RNase YbeY